MISPSSSCFNFEASSTTSPLRMVELLQWASTTVDDTTYLGRLFNLSAHSPLRPTHRGPKYSSLRRPSSRAWAPSASSNSTLAHSANSFSTIWLNQPPCLKPSSPVGSWTTPSSVTFSLITIFPISVLLRSDCYLLRVLRRRPRPKLSGEFRAAPTSLVLMSVKRKSLWEDASVTGQTLARARAGDEDASRELTDPHRRELQVHIYR